MNPEDCPWALWASFLRRSTHTPVLSCSCLDTLHAGHWFDHAELRPVEQSQACTRPRPGDFLWAASAGSSATSCDHRSFQAGQASSSQTQRPAPAVAVDYRRSVPLTEVLQCWGCWWDVLLHTISLWTQEPGTPGHAPVLCLSPTECPLASPAFIPEACPCSPGPWPSRGVACGLDKGLHSRCPLPKTWCTHQHSLVTTSNCPLEIAVV